MTKVEVQDGKDREAELQQAIEMLEQEKNFLILEKQMLVKLQKQIELKIPKLKKVKAEDVSGITLMTRDKYKSCKFMMGELKRLLKIE